MAAAARTRQLRRAVSPAAPLPPPPTTTTRARDVAFFLFAVAVLLPSIWSQSSLTGQDEYSLSFRTVLEMQARGEWLTPWVNGEIRLQKPPLLYWLMRLSFLGLGPSLFAARIWTVLAGAAFALYTAKLVRRFAPADPTAHASGAGYLAGLMALASAGVAIEARRAMFDLPVGCLATMAFYHAAQWHRRGRLGGLVLAALLLGAAGMTKGPVALWFFAAPCLAALLLRRAQPAGPWWHVGPALGVLLAVVLPWPLWVQHAHPDFWAVMANQAESREFGLAQLANAPKLLGATLGLCVPWTVAIVVAAWRALRPGGATGATAPDDPGRWLVGWVALGIVPFAFMSAFERYTIALVAPLSVLAARWLDRQPAASQRLQLSIAAGVLLVPVVAFAAFAWWFRFALWLPLVGLALAALTWRVARARTPLLRVVAGLAAATFAVLLGGIYPALGINRLPDDLPQDLATTPVATFGRPQPGMLSIARGVSVPEMSAAPDGLGERLRAFRGYLFVLDTDRDAVEAAARAHDVPLVEVLAFRSFYSRKAWLKFYREGLRWPDWQRALAARSADDLQPRFVCYRVG